jgi:ankyrin repeat protein
MQISIRTLIGGVSFVILLMTSAEAMAENANLDTFCESMAYVDSSHKNSALIEQRNTRLSAALYKKDWEAIRRLVWFGADINILSGSPFYYRALKENMNARLVGATARGDLSEMGVLIKSGADVNVDPVFISSMPPLIVAARCGQIDAVKLLLSRKANINIPGQFPVTVHGMVKNSSALIWASVAGYTNIVKLLLQNGADPNMQESNYSNVNHKPIEVSKGRTALLAAVNLETIAALIQGGARVNQTGDNLVTRLMISAARGSVNECTFLLEHGAKKELRNKDGVSAEGVAKSNGYENVYKLIHDWRE